MGSGNALHNATADAASASGNGDSPGPGPYDAVLIDYAAALEGAPLAPSSRRKYLSRARGFMAWLASTGGDGDPLSDPAARDWAVRDYRTHLKTVRRGAPATINNTLAALDDLFTRRGLGPATIRREEPPATRAPRALGERQARRYLRAVETNASARDRVVALLPYYAGLRASEVVRLDVADVRLSARKGELQVLGKGADGGKQRIVPVHAELRAALQAWLQERPRWPGADNDAGLLLNQRGGRLSDRSVRTIIGASASWPASTTTHSTPSAPMCCATPSGRSWSARASTWSPSLS